MSFSKEIPEIQETEKRFRPTNTYGRSLGVATLIGSGLIILVGLLYLILAHLGFRIAGGIIRFDLPAFLVEQYRFSQEILGVLCLIMGGITCYHGIQGLKQTLSKSFVLPPLWVWSLLLILAGALWIWQVQLLPPSSLPPARFADRVIYDCFFAASIACFLLALASQSLKAEFLTTWRHIAVALAIGICILSIIQDNLRVHLTLVLSIDPRYLVATNSSAIPVAAGFSFAFTVLNSIFEGIVLIPIIWRVHNRAGMTLVAMASGAGLAIWNSTIHFLPVGATNLYELIKNLEYFFIPILATIINIILVSMGWYYCLQKQSRHLLKAVGFWLEALFFIGASAFLDQIIPLEAVNAARYFHVSFAQTSSFISIIVILFELIILGECLLPLRRFIRRENLTSRQSGILASDSLRES